MPLESLFLSFISARNFTWMGRTNYAYTLGQNEAVRTITTSPIRKWQSRDSRHFLLSSAGRITFRQTCCQSTDWLQIMSLPQLALCWSSEEEERAFQERKLSGKSISDKSSGKTKERKYSENALNVYQSK